MDSAKNFNPLNPSDFLAMARIETDPHFPKIDRNSFKSLLEGSVTLNGLGHKFLKTNKDKALHYYSCAAGVFLQDLPEYVLEEEDFVLCWNTGISQDSKEKMQALEELSNTFYNISSLFTQIGNLLEALIHAKFSLWCNSTFFKARIRIAKALIDLYHLNEAQELLSSLKAQEEGKPYLAEMRELQSEINQLTNQLTSLETTAKFFKKQLEFRVEQAYLGPIELFDTPNKGRGYRATRNISPCETIVIEKGLVCRGNLGQLIYLALMELNNSADLRVLYSRLYPSKKIPLNMDEHQLYNVYRAFRQEYGDEWEAFSEEKIKEFTYKVALNSVGLENIKDQGLFPHISLFNHSCDPNASRFSVGDMFMLKSVREIKKGEEICIAYFSSASDKPKRDLHLKSYGIVCECERCLSTGDWKSKEAELAGIKCPECGTEIACNNERKFICPKKCWQVEYSYYEELSNKTLQRIYNLTYNARERHPEEVPDLLKTIEKEFSRFSTCRALVIQELAKLYAYKKDHENFKKCLSDIAEMMKFYPILEFRKIYVDLLIEICANLKRQPTKKELEPLKKYGISFDVIQGLWNDFKDGRLPEFFGGNYRESYCYFRAGKK